MVNKSRFRPKNHHAGPLEGRSLEYIPIDTCRDTDFPISYVVEVTPRPRPRRILKISKHDAMEIGYCHTGSGILVVDDRVEPFTAGDICVVTEKEMHVSRSAVGEQSHWSYFWMDPGMLLAGMPEALKTINADLISRPDFPSIISPRDHEELCRLVLDMVNELNRKAPDHRMVVKGMAYTLLGLLHRMCRGLPTAEVETSRSDIERIAPALHHMTNHYADPIRVDDLARLCSISIRNFRRTFVSAIGKPPLQYLAQLRARMAAAILSESSKSVSQTAFEVGFESINTFHRQFKATLGMTPKQWQKQHH